MAKKELINNIKITLPLIALSLPLFANYHVTAENGCPYETYIRLEGKCIDISEQGLNEISDELDTPNVEEVSQEIEEVNQELEELGEELEELGEEIKELCIKEQPETQVQEEILEDMCQY